MNDEANEQRSGLQEIFWSHWRWAQTSQVVFFWMKLPSNWPKLQGTKLFLGWTLRKLSRTLFRCKAFAELCENCWSVFAGQWNSWDKDDDAELWWQFIFTCWLFSRARDSVCVLQNRNNMPRKLNLQNVRVSPHRLDLQRQNYKKTQKQLKRKTQECKKWANLFWKDFFLIFC